MTNRSNEMHITSFGGLTISSSGTAETSLIPFDSSGKIPRFVRVAATAQGTMKVSANGESATSDDNPIQPGDSAVVATGGCRYISFLSTSGKLNVSALESGGWNTQSQEEYLTGLMASLMTDGTQGWWYDPSDFSTLFQDAAGTTPVTAVEQPVGLMLDKSGKGNHATQATSTSRPILRNRYNLLTKTEQFDDAVWNKSANTTMSANATIAPDGTQTAERMLAVGSGSNSARQFPAVLSGATYAFSVYIKPSTSNWALFTIYDNGSNVRRVWFNVLTGAVGSTTFGGSFALVGSSIEQVDNGWYKCSASVTIPTGAAYCWFGVESANANAALSDSAGGSLFVWGASLVLEADATLPYQRVNTATDYDSDPSKFPLYLDADGSDDGMATAAFAAGSDKVTVFAAVHKRSDAAAGEVYGFSATPASNNGAFTLTFPATAGATAQFTSKGTSASDAQASGISAPATRVLTGVGDIAADISILRANVVQAASSTADQGTGTYGTYPLYLFRRGGASLPFNGRFYGGAGKLRALSGAETSIPEQYLRMKSRAY